MLDGLMETLISALITVLRTAFLSRTGLALENAALRQQLTIYQRTQKRGHLRCQDRIFWVVLRKIWSRRIEPTRRSTNGFCHGDRAARIRSAGRSLGRAQARW